MAVPTIITVRENGTAGLKRAGAEPGLYSVTKNDDGSLLLTPADVVARVPGADKTTPAKPAAKTAPKK